MPKPKENTHASYVRKRKAALAKCGLTQNDMLVRWAEKFGSCSSSLVSQIVLGSTRSNEKERDFAEVVGMGHEDLFAPAEVRSRDTVSVTV